MVGPAAKREAVRLSLVTSCRWSERRACILVSADRKMIRYRYAPAARCRAAPVCGIGNERRRFGYRRLFILLREQGEPSGINRIYRLYREEGLTSPQAQGSAESDRNAHADPGRGQGQRALVARLRP